ncbi:MAG TPA: CaiB/BaiF CoA-transferase family protein [Caulobacteraceae bacterium]|nr:CaiB/BaiF CoA-transferase family protein [Caulobacteraceae bacterium]
MSDAPPQPKGPLADLVVVELGTLIAGPFCGQILADFGAEVIKVEDPGTGDPMRQWGRSLPQGLSPWWPVIGRNKKSVTVNLRAPEGQAIVRELTLKADVLVENFRPGTMEKWGLSWDSLAAANPRLIMARVSGFGQTGPYAARAGYGLIGEAMGGLRAITGEPDRPPARAGVSIGDSLAATHAVMGVLMALHVREKTGRGQVIDAAIYESVLAMMENLVTEYDLTGYVRERAGSVLPGIAPSNVYPTADGMILIGGNGDTVFARLCEAMGAPALKDDPRYRDHAARGVNQADLDERIAAWSKGYASAELLALLEARGVPCGRVFRAPEMLEDEQYAARDSIVTVDHPVFGKIRMQNAFPKLSETPGAVRWPGPALGEHTAAVLGEKLGLTAEKLDALKAGGVI